jgi:hypothetical protein
MPNPKSKDKTRAELAISRPRQRETKLERALEIAYAIEGVVAARVWEADGLIAVGVRPSASVNGEDVLRRVEEALRRLKDPGETWELGLMDEEI